MLHKKLNNLIIVEFIAILVVLLFALSLNGSSVKESNINPLNNVETTRNNSVIVIGEKATEVRKQEETIDESSIGVVLPTQIEVIAENTQKPTDTPTPTIIEKTFIECFVYGANTNNSFETIEQLNSYLEVEYSNKTFDAINLIQLTIDNNQVDVWEAKSSNGNENKDLYFTKDGKTVEKSKCEIK